MALLLAASGSLFALLFALNMIVQTIRRAPRIGFVHTLLAFLTTLILLAALIAANLRPEPGPRIGAIVMAAAALVAAPSLVALLLELRRPERLKGSRGVFGLGVALLLAVGTISVPFTSAYTTLMAEPTATPLIVAAARTSTPAPTQTGEERARVVFITLVDIIAEQTGLDRETIIDRLDSGISIAQMVAENGGDLDTVIAGISKVMRDQIEQLQGEGQVNRAQAALFLSQMDTFVRLAVNREWREGGLGAFLRAEATAEATTDLRLPATNTGIFAAPSLTPTPTVTPTLTRTPRPTATPTPTRQRFATRTPAPTATLPTPCLALTNFNVNLRAEPNMDAAILLTIPYETTVTLFGRSADSAWWYGGYDEQAGWLKGEFLTLSRSCADLPER